MNIIREDCATVLGGATAALAPLRNQCLMVTGGTGFVGTWIAESIAYLNDEHAFGTQLILLSSRAHSFSAKAPHLALRSDIRLIERDVRGLLDIPSEVSWIVHAAGT